MKTLILLVLICTSLCSFSSAAFSQTGKVGSTSTSQLISAPVEDPQVTEIVKNIQISRETGDVAAKTYWTNKLNEITGSEPMPLVESGLIIKKESGTVSGNGEALNVTQLSTSTLVANAISRDRVSGDIYAAVACWGLLNSDTLRVFRSTNNGITFTNLFSIATGDLKITFNGLDVEALSKGDSSYAYVCMNYILSGNKSAAIIRVRQDGGMTTTNLGAFGAVNLKYFNARITSDAAKYTSDAFVYMSLTLDSVVSGQRNLRQKLFRIENPFSSFITLLRGYQETTQGGQYAYYVFGAAADSVKFETDIAYVNTTTNVDQIYTVAVVRGVSAAFGGGTSLHFSRSATYGRTAPTLFLTDDAGYFKENLRLAATGNLDNGIMVGARRLFGGNDWDPYYYYTTDVTTSVPVFNNNYVNSSSDTTMGVSLAAKYRSPGVYLFGYNNRTMQESRGNIFIRPFTGGSLGTTVQVNPAGFFATGFYGSPDVSFRNVMNDSCLAIWGGVAGISSYVTGGCSGGFVGVENPNSLVTDYKLSQNYPNPFNPATRISYSIPKQGLVMIKLYDVLGKQVAELVNEVKGAGSYAIDFNASSFASGVYYYKIESGDFIDTKKMMLVK